MSTRLVTASWGAQRGTGPNSFFMLLSMLKTLHCAVFCSHETFARVWPAMEASLRVLNHHLVLSSRLDLQPVDGHFRTDVLDMLCPGDPSRWPVALGTAMLGVDPWSDLLVYRFLLWLSTRVPCGYVLANEEGPGAGFVPLRATCGAWGFDPGGMRAVRELLLATSRWSELDAFEEAVEWTVRTGRFFEDFPAKDFAARPEVQALGWPAWRLAEVTIEEIATYLRVPWDSDEAKRRTN